MSNNFEQRSKNFEQVIFEFKDHVATITLNRPEKLNARTAKMDTELHPCFDECQDNDDIRVVIITGAGRGFCAGRDLQELREMTKAPVLQPGKPMPTPDPAAGIGRRLIETIEKPVIAAVNGVCAGAGYCLALACDIRIASENARFAHVYLRRNLVAGGEAWFLPRIIGLGPAVYHILSADEIGAAEALRLNLVSKVVPADKLIDEAMDLGRKIAAASPTTVKFTKKAIYQGLTLDFNATMQYVGYARALQASLEKSSTES